MARDLFAVTSCVDENRLQHAAGDAQTGEKRPIGISSYQSYGSGTVLQYVRLRGGNGRRSPDKSWECNP